MWPCKDKINTIPLENDPIFQLQHNSQFGVYKDKRQVIFSCRKFGKGGNTKELL